jgi:hypothetical protein
LKNQIQMKISSKSQRELKEKFIPRRKAYVPLFQLMVLFFKKTLKNNEWNPGIKLNSSMIFTSTMNLINSRKSLRIWTAIQYWLKKKLRIRRRKQRRMKIQYNLPRRSQLWSWNQTVVHLKKEKLKFSWIRGNHWENTVFQSEKICKWTSTSAGAYKSKSKIIDLRREVLSYSFVMKDNCKKKAAKISGSRFIFLILSRISG